jgi:hypothetical protein
MPHGSLPAAVEKAVLFAANRRNHAAALAGCRSAYL